MSDLTDDSLPEWTDEELSILRAADGDTPPTRSLPATLAAVGVGGALASGAAAAKGASLVAGAGASAGASSAITTAKWTSVLALGKWAGVIAVGGALVTGGVVLARRAEPRREEASAKTALAKAEPVPVLRSPETTAETAASAAPLALAKELPSAGADVPAPVPPSASGHAIVLRSQPDISLEIAALDEARTALRTGRTAEALASLDRYDGKFSRGGSLRVEATELRIEALLKSGKSERARSLANVFLARNSKSPYATRIRALLGDAPASH